MPLPKIPLIREELQPHIHRGMERGELPQIEPLIGAGVGVSRTFCATRSQKALYLRSNANLLWGSSSTGYSKENVTKGLSITFTAFSFPWCTRIRRVGGGGGGCVMCRQTDTFDSLPKGVVLKEQGKHGMGIIQRRLLQRIFYVVCDLFGRQRSNSKKALLS